jgi:hypothetical protein
VSNGLPPPVEFAWTTPVSDLLKAIYAFSPDLVDDARAPRLIMMYADRLQVNWQLSTVEDPAAQSVIDIYFSARPVAPATIVINPANQPQP